MIRALIHLAIFITTALLGLLVASWALPDFVLSLSGILIAVVVFALAQTILTPFIVTVAKRYAPALLGGIGLISTWVALFIATLVGDGLRISGVMTWVLGTLIVWLVNAIGGWLLPLVLLKKKLGDES